MITLAAAERAGPSACRPQAIAAITPSRAVSRAGFGTASPAQKYVVCRAGADGAPAPGSSMAPTARPTPPTAPEGTVPASHTASGSPAQPARRAVVVGAGPAGILASMYLAKMGFQVACYERSEEPSAEQRRSQRSYPMVLARRATLGFEEVGASPACCSPGTAVPNGGTFSNGVLRAMGDAAAVGSEELRTWIVDRVGLAADMLAEARRLWPERIRFHFQAPLVSADLSGRRAVFDVDGRQVVEDGYELLVGADGANSVVRSEMEAQLPGFSSRTLYRAPATAVYKTFHGLPVGGGAAGEAATSKGACRGSEEEVVPGISGHRPRQHLYRFDSGRGGPVVTCWLTEAGQLDGMIAMVNSWEPAALSTSLTAVPPHLREAVVAAVGGAARQPSRFGRVLSCSTMHGPRVVLLGDAAHAVTSTLGQGCNMALESVRAFAACLERAGGDVDQALPAFSAARRGDVDAFQHLELCMVAFVTRSRPSGPDAPADSRLSPTFRAYATALMMSTMLWGAVLHKLLPARYRFPMYLFSAFRDAGVSFGAARRACRAMLAASLAAMAAVAAVAAAAALALARAWR